jgi:hypothetical protein
MCDENVDFEVSCNLKLAGNYCLELLPAKIEI